MDRNGYNPSRFTTEAGECFICFRHADTARHEIMQGICNRRLSKMDGLWINVCPECHDKIHANPKRYLWLKEAAQRLYESEYGHEDWMWRYGKNYLEEKEWR